MNQYLIYGVGFLAQLLFSGRLIIQWIASERAKKVLSPTIFWKLSMIASFMLCLYGWLRHDFAIIVGQLISYYIYIWNLRSKGAWDKFNTIFRILFLYIPPVAVAFLLMDWRDTIAHLFEQKHIPLWLILFGTLGQFTFTLRFIYQWLYSRRLGESILPKTFWIISLSGSLLIIAYALIRRDPVLILGQSTGVIVYVRNLMIGWKATKNAVQ
ncbi:MAG: lipid-A-disaccharide synthase N-terminal domain-containing protein [Rikenellaceae bacterium]